MFDRWFDSFTEVVAAAAAAAACSSTWASRSSGGRRSCGICFTCSAPIRPIMADHLEEMARRGLIRPYRPGVNG